ncbi:MAG: hypothetical protein CM15mP74_00240 [Halieaceae bacterium]|nr:MAG: hypothetical protein CM15mP74_00240 [Halieaceae bacterium]
MFFPIVMYTEGGGGRPGDTDGFVDFWGLNGLPSIAGRPGRPGSPDWGNHGYFLPGNAALLAPRIWGFPPGGSCIGMAGPAMIEGGGLGTWETAGKLVPVFPGASENGVVGIESLVKGEGR